MKWRYLAVTVEQVPSFVCLKSAREIPAVCFKQTQMGLNLGISHGLVLSEPPFQQADGVPVHAKAANWRVVDI